MSNPFKSTILSNRSVSCIENRLSELLKNNLEFDSISDWINTIIPLSWILVENISCNTDLLDNSHKSDFIYNLGFELKFIAFVDSKVPINKTWIKAFVELLLKPNGIQQLLEENIKEDVLRLGAETLVEVYVYLFVLVWDELGYVIV